MLPTSGTYNFQSTSIELLIRLAFQKIGISGEFIEPVKLETAKNNLNILQSMWMNKGINLWTLQTSYLTLNQNQGQYNLSNIVSKVIQAVLRTSTRQLNGTPQSNTGATYDNGGGGNPLFAFDGNPATACTQAGANGNISYDYGQDAAGNNITQQINFIGIQTNINVTYSLLIEYSQDSATWTTLLSIPGQAFVTGVNQWFDIPTPLLARYYRVRETGGATLNLQEIYFNNNVYDTELSEVSRSEYESFPNKYQQSCPNVYYFNRQIAPILNIWPVPSSTYNCLRYTYEQMLEDVGAYYTNTLEIPARFYPAAIFGLSWLLALDFAPEKAADIEARYLRLFNEASVEDTESTPVTMNISYDNGYYI